MKTLLKTALAILIVAGSAHAACGGGGNAKKIVAATPPAAPVLAEVVSLTDDLSDSADVVSVNAGKSLTHVARFDAAQLEKLSAKLQLTTAQRTEISTAMLRIQARSEAPRAAYENAQKALVACNGKCDAEGQKLEQATRELTQFDPNHAFADMLVKILKPDQFAQL